MAGNHYSNKVKIILQAGDLLFLNVAFWGASSVTTHHFSFLPKDQTFSFLIMINLIWYVLASNSDLYNIDRLIRIDKNIYKALFLVSIHYVIVSLLLYLTGVFNYTNHQLFILYFLVYYCIFAGKILLLMGLKYMRRQGYYIRNVVIVGGGRVGDEIKALMTSDFSFGFRYLGTFDEKPNICQFKTAIKGNLDEFKAFAVENKVDVVFIALPDTASEKVSELMQFCDANTIRAKIVPDFMSYIRSRIKLDFYGNIPIILLRQEPLESYRNRFIKRCFDICFSLFFIVFILSWLIPLLGILIKMESKGPVFFLQRRTGLNNKEFNIIKFRTMCVNDEANKRQVRKGDPRITKLGALLRKTNIDEFPQFFNVLMGNMSVIGPRPHMLQHTQFYAEIIDSYLVRHFVKPGLTGWAQVNGFRGDTTNPAQMRGRVKHDVFYIENWSVMLDIRIFFKTIYNMYKGEEAAV